MTTKKELPKKTMTIDRLFLRLGPDDVVLAVKRHEHQASILGFTGEPVHGFAGHHGKAAGAKCRFRHAVHPREHVAPDHHQLFFRGVIVRGNHAPGRSFEKKRGSALIRVTVLARNLETRGFAIENKVGARERRNYAVSSGLPLSLTVPRTAECR